jgi:hypothetical protein
MKHYQRRKDGSDWQPSENPLRDTERGYEVKEVQTVEEAAIIKLTGTGMYANDRELYISGAKFGAQWQLGQQAQSGWVDVKDRLPENEWWYRVLVNGKHHILPHTYEDGKWYEYAQPRPTDLNITHWKYFDDLPPHV